MTRFKLLCLANLALAISLLPMIGSDAQAQSGSRNSMPGQSYAAPQAYAPTQSFAPAQSYAPTPAVNYGNAATPSYGTSYGNGYGNAGQPGFGGSPDGGWGYRSQQYSSGGWGQDQSTILSAVRSVDWRDFLGTQPDWTSQIRTAIKLLRLRILKYFSRVHVPICSGFRDLAFKIQVLICKN